MNRRLLFLLLVPVVVGGCTSPSRSGNPCAGSAPPYSTNRPVVCVNDDTLTAITSTPEDAHAKHRAPIKWYTKSGQGGLSIEFTDDTCVSRSGINCGAGSRCDAQIVDAGAAGHSCKYTVKITRDGVTNTQDPVVILDDGVYVEKE